MACLAQETKLCLFLIVNFASFSSLFLACPAFGWWQRRRGRPFFFWLLLFAVFRIWNMCQMSICFRCWPCYHFNLLYLLNSSCLQCTIINYNAFDFSFPFSVYRWKNYITRWQIVLVARVRRRCGCRVCPSSVLGLWIIAFDSVIHGVSLFCGDVADSAFFFFFFFL